MSTQSVGSNNNRPRCLVGLEEGKCLPRREEIIEFLSKVGTIAVILMVRVSWSVKSLVEARR